MADTTTDKLAEFTLALASIYGGVKTAEAQADQAAMMSQFEALRLQQSAPVYDAQSLSQPLTAGLGSASGGSGTLLLLAIVGISVYLIASQ